MTQSDAFAALVGPAGAGKTTVLAQVAADLAGRPVRVLRVGGALSRGGAPDGLGLRELVAQLAGGGDPVALRDEDRERAFEALTELDADAERIVLLVDDAQALDPAALRYLQLAGHSGPMLRVVLAGPPEAFASVAAEEFAWLRERVRCRVELPPLGEEEARALAEHLLRDGGSSGRRALAPDAIDAVLRYADGNPGRIHALVRRVKDAAPPTLRPPEADVSALPAAAARRPMARATDVTRPGLADRWAMRLAYAGLATGAAALTATFLLPLARPLPQPADTPPPVAAAPAVAGPDAASILPSPPAPAPPAPVPPAPTPAPHAVPAPQARPIPLEEPPSARPPPRTALDVWRDQQRCHASELKAQRGEAMSSAERRLVRAGCNEIR